jgi:hypothetical protein
MSHYDMMRPDFDAMKRQGIIGVIHEASYPAFQRDSKYLDRQMGALRAGLLWGAYHYANGSDPIRQADHFLSVVSNAWAQANPVTRPSAGVLLVLDFEKNGHYSGGTMRPEQAIAFIERIHERTGVYPGVYSGEYHLSQVLNSPRVTFAQKRTLTGLQTITRSHAQPRRGITGPFGNTAVTASVAFRVQVIPPESPTLTRRSSTCFAAIEVHCRNSGSGVHGTRQEESLAPNRSGHSPPNCKARTPPRFSSTYFEG